LSTSKGPRIPLSKTGPRATHTAKVPRGLDPQDPDLQEDLEIACLDALRGDPPGEGVARRLERACLAVLNRYGVSQPYIRATSNRSGTKVCIRLPDDNARVREVILTLG